MRALATSLLAAALALSIAAAPSSVRAQSGQDARAVLTAEALLNQGNAEPAYFRAVEMMEAAGETADLHVVAAKAALLRAKSAPLLGKKRWAKLGRDHYQSALALDDTSKEALLGLATFALRAPNKLGGGETALADYSAQLETVSPSLYAIFQARVALEDKQLDVALGHYEGSLKQSDQALFEYVDAAEKAKSELRAYTALTLSGISETPCASFALARLAGGTSDGEAAQHYDAFLQSDERFCDRRYVAIEAVDAAIKQAQGAKQTERLVQLLAQKAQFEAERAQLVEGRSAAS